MCTVNGLDADAGGGVVAAVTEAGLLTDLLLLESPAAPTTPEICYH